MKIKHFGKLSSLFTLTALLAYSMTIAPVQAITAAQRTATNAVPEPDMSQQTRQALTLEETFVPGPNATPEEVDAGLQTSAETARIQELADLTEREAQEAFGAYHRFEQVKAFLNLYHGIGGCAQFAPSADVKRKEARYFAFIRRFGEKKPSEVSYVPTFINWGDVHYIGFNRRFDYHDVGHNTLAFTSKDMFITFTERSWHGSHASVVQTFNIQAKYGNQVARVRYNWNNTLTIEKSTNGGASFTNMGVPGAGGRVALLPNMILKRNAGNIVLYGPEAAITATAINPGNFTNSYINGTFTPTGKDTKVAFGGLMGNEMMAAMMGATPPAATPGVYRIAGPWSANTATAIANNTYGKTVAAAWDGFLPVAVKIPMGLYVPGKTSASQICNGATGGSQQVRPQPTREHQFYH
jgi:hypothetical protein